MRRKLMICMVTGGVLVVLIGGGLFALEYKRVANLCSGATSPINTRHDAINAVRQSRGWPFPGETSAIRQFDSFKNDGSGKEGGWDVQEWAEWFFIRGYTVGFQQYHPDVALICEVYQCGAVDNYCHAMNTTDF